MLGKNLKTIIEENNNPGYLDKLLQNNKEEEVDFNILVKLINNSKNIDSEFVEIVNNNFWDLV